MEGREGCYCAAKDLEDGFSSALPRRKSVSSNSLPHKPNEEHRSVPRFLHSGDQFQYARKLLSVPSLTWRWDPSVGSVHSAPVSLHRTLGDGTHLIHSLRYKHPDTSFIGHSVSGYYALLNSVSLNQVFNSCCLEPFRVFFPFLPAPLPTPPISVLLRPSRGGVGTTLVLRQHLDQQVVVGDVPVQVLIVQVLLGLHADGPDSPGGWSSSCPNFCLLRVEHTCIVQQGGVDLLLDASSTSWEFSRFLTSD